MRGREFDRGSRGCIRTPEPDARVAPVDWRALSAGPTRRPNRLLMGATQLCALLAVVLYLRWLLVPGRVGNPILYVLVVAAELFNVVQAAGFWWTCSRRRTRGHRPLGRRVAVDVMIPVYGEPVEVVEPTLRAALAMRGADVNVLLLDDGGSPRMELLARRFGASYVRRTVHQGAKAGNINHALARTRAPFVAVFDCDHVPDPSFLERTLGHFDDPEVAVVQTPQYYANHRTNPVAAASWSQQALFFGPIACGKDAVGAMFCCGTNVVLRRKALDVVGGFPERSLTEDFQLSIAIHEAGWKTVYLPEVLARGLGPEDMASYVGQQHRWARGCLTGIPRILMARIPLRLKAQYLLSASYFLTGWTVAIYVALPVVRMLTGAQPLAGATADQFLLHFAPYFGLSLATVALAGAGGYSFSAFCLAAATAWVQVHAAIKAVMRRPGRFVVTPKHGSNGHQPWAVAPTLAAMGLLAIASLVGLARDQGPAMLNNVAFATLHFVVLGNGARLAIGDRKVAMSERTFSSGAPSGSPPVRWVSDVVATAAARRSA